METSSLRDFPQEFRTFKIVRNTTILVSIFVTDVDPAVQEDPEAPPDIPCGEIPRVCHRRKQDISGRYLAFTDKTSHVYNAELIKPLATPYTMTVNVTGPGTVISSPYSGIHCRRQFSCSATYLPGTDGDPCRHA